MAFFKCESHKKGCPKAKPCPGKGWQMGKVEGYVNKKDFEYKVFFFEDNSVVNLVLKEPQDDWYLC